MRLVRRESEREIDRKERRERERSSKWLTELI